MQQRLYLSMAQCSRSTQAAVGKCLPIKLLSCYRQDGSLLVQRAETMPSADELIWASQSGYEAASRPEIEDPDETLSDPIDAIQDDFDEPDVPAVDLA